MNLHPELATALIAQRERELLRREPPVEPIRFRRRPQLGLDGRSA